ncbi:MAG: hypothetical protein KME12_09790 [Trichocoleus desertorum ATA4-8-CV12]|jgi:hypothetical protein|nr:hypothetical protein [Trichocoleus desertorum ATA4-8-CV12]
MLKSFNSRLANCFNQSLARISRRAIATVLSLLVAIALWMPGDAWALNSNLGVTLVSLQGNFEQLGFRLEPKTETAFIGKSKDGVATVRLNVTPKELVTNAVLVVHKPLTKQRKPQTLNYMEEFLQVMLPDWNEAHDWLAQGITDATDFGSTDLVVGDRRVYLLIPKTKEALLLAVDPLDYKR